MDDKSIQLPANYKDIQIESERLHFSMPSDLQTGSFLRTLVASKPQAKILELGTGTELSLAWIVEGMDSQSQVTSIDINKSFQAVAKRYFENDHRVDIIEADVNKWIGENQGHKFDLIFADAWPGKYEMLDETLQMLKPGGIYLIDDMNTQPNWPAGHQDNVARLIHYLDTRSDLALTKLNWSTGLIMVVKTI